MTNFWGLTCVSAMNENQELPHPQETTDKKAICRRPGCGLLNCKKHCICPHCLCHNDAIGQRRVLERWCRRCKKGKCKLTGLKKQHCLHEGCKEHPCPKHCQCKDCFPCERRPIGLSSDAKRMYHSCSKCHNKRCCVKAEPPSSACTEPPQGVEVPMSVDPPRTCSPLPPRDADVQVRGTSVAM